jgi:hypothetical protein
MPIPWRKPLLFLRAAAFIFQSIAIWMSVAVNSYTNWAYTGFIDVPIVRIPLKNLVFIIVVKTTFL